MEFTSFRPPEDEICVPLYAGNCNAEQGAILLKVLHEIRAGFIQKKWKVGIRQGFNFEQYPSRAFDTDDLPPFMIVHLDPTTPGVYFAEMRDFVKRGVMLLGVMCEDWPVVRQTFEIAGGRACFTVPADSSLYVQEMQAFLDKGIPLKS